MIIPNSMSFPAFNGRFNAPPGRSYIGQPYAALLGMAPQQPTMPTAALGYGAPPPPPPMMGAPPASAPEAVPGTSPIPAPGGGMSSFFQSPIVTAMASSLLANGGAFRPAMASFGQQMPQLMADQKRSKAISAAIRARSGSLSEADKALLSDPANADIAEKYLVSTLVPKQPFVVPKGGRIYDPASGTFVDTGGGTQADNGTYGGTSMDAQNWNIILQGKTDTPEYAAAYSQLFQQPKLSPVQTDQGVQFIPQMPVIPSTVKPPSAQAAAAAGTDQQPQAPGDNAPIAASPAGGIGKPIPVPGTAPKLTEQQIRNRQLYSVVAPEMKIIEDNFAELAKGSNQAASEILPKDIEAVATSPGYQRAWNSLRTVVASYLYSTSGATANPGEVDTQTRVMMPKPFEDPTTVADKLQRIKTMVESIRQAGLVNPGMPQPAGNAAPPPPDGIQTVQTPDDAMALPSGTKFRTPDGRVKVRP